MRPWSQLPAPRSGANSAECQLCAAVGENPPNLESRAHVLTAVYTLHISRVVGFVALHVHEVAHKSPPRWRFFVHLRESKISSDLSQTTFQPSVSPPPTPLPQRRPPPTTAPPQTLRHENIQPHVKICHYYTPPRALQPPRHEWVHSWTEQSCKRHSRLKRLGCIAFNVI